MAGMRIQRYRSRRSGLSGCGCLALGGMSVVLLAGLLYATGLLLPLVLAATGVARIGDTESLFQDATPQPTEVLSNPSRPGTSINLNLGGYGNTTLNSANPNYTIMQGTNSSGEAILSASASPDSLLSLCADWTAACREGINGLRIIGFDLLSDGAVIQVEADARLASQQAGVVLRLDPTSHRSFSVIGVDIGGVTYDPETLPLGLSDSLSELVSRLESEGNTLLRDLSAQVGNTRYTLQSISIDRNNLTLTMR